VAGTDKRLMNGRPSRIGRWFLRLPNCPKTAIARGLKKGDLSKFVEDAVQWRLMKLNIAEARARNVHLRPEEIEAAVDQALDEVRAGLVERPTSL
jgi:Ribbon-helix-helix domain